MKKNVKLILLIYTIASVLLLVSSCGCSHANREWRVEIEPTWSTGGLTVQVCKDCGEQTSTYSIPSLLTTEFNDYYTVQTVVERTCTSGGHAKFFYQSGALSAVFESDTPPLEHTYGITYAPDERSSDYHFSYCQCGASLREEHYNANITGEPSTCTEQGYYYKSCYDCDFEQKMPLQLAPHVFETVTAVEPTCQSGGTVGGERCTVCGFSESVKELEKVECSFVDGYCKWCHAKLVYCVTYVNGEERETVEFAYGEKFDDKILTSTDYSAFLGWYNEDGTVKYNSQSEITVGMTVYAKWETAIAVSTAEDFIAIVNSPSKSFYLTNDINLKGEVLTPIANFSGTLNGCGYTVKNFSVTTTELSDYQGLFRVNEGRISNIVFADYTFNINVPNAQRVKYGAGVGALVGYNTGIISDVKLVQSSVNTSITVSMPKGTTHSIFIHVGGFIGVNAGRAENIELDFVNNVILNLHNGSFGISGDACDIEMDFNVGKVIGYNTGDAVSVYNKGNLTVDTELSREQHNLTVTVNVGGFVGRNDGVANKSSYQGEINYDGDTSLIWLEAEYASVGGFVGLNYGKIYESYADATITGGCESGYKVGGFVGYNDNEGKISSCYATPYIAVSVSGAIYAGGFVGLNDALIQSSYCTGTVDALVGATLGGFAGANSQGGTITKSYTKTGLNANSGVIGRFTAVNLSIITKAYYLDTAPYYAGSSTSGEMAVTTDIKSISSDELYSDGFFVDLVYWNEEGWTILDGQSDPILSWQIEGIRS